VTKIFYSIIFYDGINLILIMLYFLKYLPWYI
jgi:hypothetical protein